APLRDRLIVRAAVAARFVTRAAFSPRPCSASLCVSTPLLPLCLRIGAPLLALSLCLGPVLRPVFLAFGSLLLRIARPIAALLCQFLAVIHPVFTRIFARVVIVVPGVVVHVGAAVPPVRTVVVAVVHCRADGDACRESDESSGHGIGAAALLDDNRRRGRLGIDDRRIVLRDVNDLRVRRLDDDHLLAARRGLRLHLLLRVALE